MVGLVFNYISGLVNEAIPFLVLLQVLPSQQKDHGLLNKPMQLRMILCSHDNFNVCHGPWLNSY